MAAGDVQKEFGFKKGEVTLQTTTGCTKGYVLGYNTDGYAHTTITLLSTYLTYRPVVALETVTAPAAGQSTAEVLEEGVVDIYCDNTCRYYEGNWMGLSATAGQAQLWSGFSLCNGIWNVATDNIASRIGYLMADKAYGTAYAKTRFLPT